MLIPNNPLNCISALATKAFYVSGLEQHDLD